MDFVRLSTNAFATAMLAIHIPFWFPPAQCACWTRAARCWEFPRLDVSGLEREPQLRRQAASLYRRHYRSRGVNSDVTPLGKSSRQTAHNRLAKDARTFDRSH
jgi:hypothetical protein